MLRYSPFAVRAVPLPCSIPVALDATPLYAWSHRVQESGASPFVYRDSHIAAPAGVLLSVLAEARVEVLDEDTRLIVH